MVISCTGKAISPFSTQKAAGAARVVARHIVDALAHEFDHEQAGAQLFSAWRPGRRLLVRRDVSTRLCEPPALPVVFMPSLRPSSC